MPGTSLILVGLFFLMINVPCAIIFWLGRKFIEKLGRYPSQTPAIQIDLCIKLAIVEVVSFTFIMAVFKILSPDSGAGN
mgnify:CR=1 FL=1